MDTLEDPEQIATLMAELLVTLYESRATRLGEKRFMILQSMSNMTFDSDVARTHTYDLLSNANGIPHDEDVLIIYRKELARRLSVADASKE
jgi:hypothetical protein